MARYVLKFTKEGYMRYTSHLDLLRLFKRLFKRANIKLSYSQGFNPHPKMGFAQPLSLGYSGMGELIEIETEQALTAEEIKSRLTEFTPEGLNIIACVEYGKDEKSLAAAATSAEYLISIPCKKEVFKDLTPDQACQEFLSQKEIIVQKRQKKTKQLADTDIKNKIIKLEFTSVDENIIISTVLDAGSESNLSPELLISAFVRFFDVTVSAYDIDVLRKKINFNNDFTI